MKNLLKFISIGLVMAIAIFSQITPTQTVEAGNDAIANNDIEFMANNASSEAKIQKYYPASKTGGTANTTHDVRFYINDADLNTVKKGVTVWAGANGTTACPHAKTWNIDEDEGAAGHCNVVLETAGEGANHSTVAGGNLTGVEDANVDGPYNTGASPKTALVANTLNLIKGSTNLTFNIDAQSDTDGTFSLAADLSVGDGVGGDDVLRAFYDFNSVDTYAVGTKRAKVTSTSDSTGEWVALAEIAAITGTAAAIDSQYSTGTIQVGPDASHAAANNSVVWVQDGDTLTVTYYAAATDSNGDGSIADSEVGAVIATTTATIDDSAPTVSNITPADGTLTKDTAPEITFTIEDSGSGLGTTVTTLGTHVDVYIRECIIMDASLNVKSFSENKIEVVYTPPVNLKYSDTALGAGSKAIDCEEGVADEADEGRDRETGGYEINTVADTADATNKRTHDGTEYSWKIVATDAAGNAKTVGATSGSSDLNVIIDSEAPVGTPTITAAKAWDSGDKKDIDDNSSVKIAFNESIDSATVEASDFTVSGVGVTSSTIESVTVGGTAALTGTQIYLDLAADLGPNAKPKVKLVGQISDLAGNVLKPSTTETTGKTLGTATDGVKPTLSDLALGDELLSDKETTKFTYIGNENMTKTSQTLAQGCTCGSIVGTNSATADLTAGGAGGDTTKLTVSLTNPTSGTADVKETVAPFNSDGIYGIVAVGLDAADNKGLGGITKVTDEDISKYFVNGSTDELLGAGHVTDAVLDTNAEKIKVKLKNWPLADSDGDGELSDEIIGLSVNGTALASTNLDDLLLIHADYGEAETISIEAVNIANATAGVDADGAIGAGDTVKITYYYVNAENTVEVDTSAPGASFSPTDGTSTTDTTPSLSVTWDDDEYAGDTQKTVTLTKADLKDPDGVTTSILDQMTTTDNISFYYKPTTAMALGEYKLTFKAKDVALNESSDKSFKVTIKARTKNKITMSPGWNLVSLPGEPADGAINTVITSSQVDTVLTYDPSTPGGWLTAVRDGDSLVGTLETIDASHAYWVMSNNSDPIEVEIPGYVGGTAQVPPAISIVEGWNLIPAVTLTGAASWDADVYLQGVDWVKAKSWNAAAETWADVLPDLASQATRLTDDTNIVSGKGYWLYANEAGVIVP